MEPGQAVMIGDVLAISEELLPGPGTYDDGAHIRAARLGVFKIDQDEFAAIVDPATKIPVELRPGDLVVGEVYIVKESMVGMAVKARVGDLHRNITGSTDATLHVAKAADRYIHSLEDHFKKGDIVRAEVVNAKPSLQITTKGRGLGVIKARCSRCRNDLVIQDNQLECRECGNIEFRHVAADYGQGRIEPLEEEMRDIDLREPPRERREYDRGPPRRGGPGGGRGRGGPGGGRDRRGGGDRREGGGGRGREGGRQQGGRGGGERREGGGGGERRDGGRSGGRPRSGGGGGGGRGGRGGGERREGGGGGGREGGRSEGRGRSGGGGGGGGGQGGPRRRRSPE